MNKISVLLCCLFMSSSIFGQLEISLNSASHDNSRQCYQISITNAEDTDVSLLGQNYRLYYDSEASMFDEKSLNSFLAKESYTEMKIVQHYHNVDASDFGSLPFEQHLGFINIAVDFKDEVGKSAVLQKGMPFNVAEICFDNVSTDRGASIVWASEESTGAYATAFVEVSIQEANNSKAIAAKIRALDVSSDDKEEVETALSMDFYPNPFVANLNIEFDEPLASDGKVEISDIFGNLLSTTQVKKGDWTHSLDGNLFTSGSYLIKVSLDSGQEKTIKAIKIQ